MKIVIAIAALVVAWVAITLALNLPRERRLRQLAKARAGDSFDGFRQSLSDLPDDVVADVYRRVQALVADGFPIRATDQLMEALEIDQGALEDLIEELAGPKPARTGVPIVTVGDLARAVASARRA
jgi:hypothetical protein